MRIKMKRFLGILLSLALVLGLMPGMNLTAYATPTETLLTTITATGKEQASYSVDNVATVSFSYTTNGYSSYTNNGTTATWGWWGYGWTATVTPADGYTITKCVFYDDKDRTATDSKAPFVVETTEEDKTPKVNGTPILANTSKGIKKIEVYGYATPAHTHSFTYAADGATITATCSDTSCALHSSPATLTLSAIDTTYTGSAYTGASLTDTTTWTGAGLTAPTIEYAGRGNTSYTKSTTAPTAAGTYTASITVDTATANVEYTISKADPTANAPTATATYGQTLSDVTLTNPNGNTPGTWAWVDTGTTSVGAVGSNTFKANFTPTDTDNYNSKSNVDVSITVNDKTAVTIGTSDKSADYSPNGIAIPVDGMFTIPDNAGDPSYNVITGTGIGSYDAQSGKLTVTKCGTFTVTVNTAETATHAAGNASATLTVNKAVGVTATVAANNRTYDGTEKPLVTVTGEATGGTMQYALGTTTAATEPYTTSIPAKTEAGTYYVWFKVSGDENYNGTVPVVITVRIAKADQTIATSMLPAQSEASYAVTVMLPSGESSARYEYDITEETVVTDNFEWKQLPTIRNGQFLMEWLSPNTTYKIWLRRKEDANHNASETISKTFTTPAKVMLSYDANSGSGILPAAKLYDAGDTTDVIDEGTGISRYGYSLGGWNTEADGNGTARATGATGFTINSTTVLYAQWTANTYKVKFDANGGTGTMEDEEFTFDVAKALTANSFTKDNYTFVGWALSSGGEMIYMDQQSVKNLAPSGEVTLYAAWVPSGYSISGTVKAADKTPASGVKVKIMRGSVEYGSEQTTSTDGIYTFNTVPAGTYNIVVEKGTSGNEDYRKMTTLVEVKSNRTVDDITLPTARVNSVVDVQNNTPQVMAGELDKVARDEVVEGHEVTVTMKVETKTESSAAGADEIKVLADSTLKSGVDVEVDYLDIKVEKKVDNAMATTISETGHVIEMVVPFNFTNRKNCQLFRYHDDVAEQFSKLSSRPSGNFRDATFYADRENSRIYIYGKKFSTYAISYTSGDIAEEDEGNDGGNVTPGDNGGSGGNNNPAVSTYTVTFNANGGSGTMNPQAFTTKAALRANTFTRTGYSFDGWNTKADGSGKFYLNEEIIMPRENMTLYAQWKKGGSDSGDDTDGDDDSDNSDDSDNGDVTANGKSEYANEISINSGLKVSQTGKKFNVSWGKVKGANRYEIYVAYCGSKYEKKPVKTITKNGTTSVTIKKLNGKKLSLKKNFKVYVVAYKVVKGKKKMLGKTITAHVIGCQNTKYTNVKSIKLKKSKVTLKKGKTTKIKASVVFVDPNKKILPDSHAAKFRYASSNKKIATVTKNGKIKAEKKGTCIIYVYAKNGFAKKVKVTVK